MSEFESWSASLFKAWGETPASLASVRIAQNLQSKRHDLLVMLTFNSLADAAGKDVDQPTLLSAVRILTAGDEPILEPRFLLLDECGDEVEIPPESLRDARKFGTLIHPTTGEPDPDFERHVIPYFIPNLQRLGMK